MTTGDTEPDQARENPWSRGQRAVKRGFDLVAGGLGFVVLAPLLAAAALSIWLYDRHNPFYVAERLGRSGRKFHMVKLRSMVVDADSVGVDSTAGDDPRITPVGKVVRKTKLDEFMQLWNVVRGEMSLVGPRPQVQRDARLYTSVERGLLAVRPGITDFASIVFADESDILEGEDDPDLRYNQVIRPWKSRMGLHYIRARSLGLDIRLIMATILSGVTRSGALRWVAQMLEESGAEPLIVKVARRDEPLEPAPPPGASEIVQSRESPPAEEGAGAAGGHI